MVDIKLTNHAVLSIRTLLVLLVLGTFVKAEQKGVIYVEQTA